MSVKHPAKFNDKLISSISTLLKGDEKIIDIFGGTGKVFNLLDYHPKLAIRAVELEPEWAKMDSRIICGNSLFLPFPNESFDGVVTSPAYGNRMADKLGSGKWAFTRNSYASFLMRELSQDNGAGMQWGDEYRRFHTAIWVEAKRVLKPDGFIILNMKDHVRKGKIQLVTDWHVTVLENIGFRVTDHLKINLSGNGRGDNANIRVPFESVIRLDVQQ